MIKTSKHTKCLCSIKFIIPIAITVSFFECCKVSNTKNNPENILKNNDTIIVYPAPGTANQTDSLKHMLDEKRKSKRKK
jgi:hypothetical protein